MNWPTPTDYRHAIQDPGHALADEELRQGEAARNARGLPTLWSGNFASVFRIDCPAAGNTWALKCFTREVRARQERYRHIAAALSAARLPFTVPFEYLERGIQVGGQWYPAVKMQWVEGQTLNRFVEESLDKPAMLRQLLALWPKLAARLRDAGIAHADLQHGNVLLVRQRGGQLALRLIDYDGMYVPALAGTESGESGHPNYQHPRRREQRAYNLDVDRFSHLAIYCAVHGLMVGKRELWQRFNNDENLLFRESDFRQPRQSELFRTLWDLGDPAGRALAGRLALACERPLASTPWLDEIVQGREVKELTPAEQQAIGFVLTVRAAVPAGPTVAVPPPQPLSRVATQDATPGIIAPPDPLPAGTQPGATAGTEPDALPTISVTTVSRRSSRQRSVIPLPDFGRLSLRGLKAFNRGLARLAGENNTSMHGVLRVVLVIVAAMFAVILFGALGMWSSGRRPVVAGRDAGVESVESEAEAPLEKELAIDLGGGELLEMVCLPLDGKANRPLPDPNARGNHLGELPRGNQTFGGVPFHVGESFMQLGSPQLRSCPDKIENIPVDRLVQRLHVLHATQFGGPVFPVPVGSRIGEYIVRYEDGERETIPIVYGEDVLDWWDQNEPVTAKRGIVAWTGHSPMASSQGFSIRLYLSTWENPYPAKRVAAIDFVSSMRTVAAPFCVAITVAEPAARHDASQPGPPLSAERGISIDLGGGVMLKMVLIPAGEFMMGSPDSTPNANSNERPQHRVRITRPFYLGKYEITQEQWRAVMGNNPSHFKGSQNPVERVSWNDCQKFVGKLNERVADAQREFRLPTEAEWEYACRAGTTMQYSFGDDTGQLNEYAWHKGNSGRRTHPVGQKRPNAWGLYDMHGNVWEWCIDRFDSRYYANSPTHDPLGPVSGSYRVNRGGCWDSYAGSCRSANRDWFTPNAQYSYLGFRVALIPADREYTDDLPQRAQPEPLRLQPIAARRIQPGSTVSLTVLPEEPEKWSGRLGFALAAGIPPGAAIGPATGEFTWTPAANQKPGTYRFDVSVAGPEGQESHVHFSIVVTRPRRAPIATGDNEIAIDLGGGVNLEMVLIPAGEFMMGSPDSDPDGQANEKPQHRVRIARPFYLGKYEVTQEEWETVMGSNPSLYKGRRNPVERVSWNACQEFLRRLNEEGLDPWREFRLPTEAEWEYACRAGSETRFCFGNEASMLGQYAWFKENSGAKMGPAGGKTYPVGGLKANAWGLHDMHGNVWEWCADWSERGDYTKLVTDDPASPARGSLRIHRGGCWNDLPSICRSAYRRWEPPGFLFCTVGFRVAHDFKEHDVRLPAPGAPADLSVTDPDGQKAHEDFSIAVTRPPLVIPASGAKEIAIDLGGGVTLEMVLIPAGEFLMGSPESEETRNSDEKPQHRVQITRPFYLGKYEVTQQQWESVMGTNPSRFKGPQRPVEHVSWNDCQDFLGKLTARVADGRRQFRLPTNAEWEYACRAGTSTRYGFGDGAGQLGDYGWYRGNSGGQTHPVGQKLPNAWGLYDMHGNVWEWCLDWYGRGYYANSPTADPPGPPSGSHRLARGGAWDGDAWGCRAALRYVSRPDQKAAIRGFRVALAPADQPAPASDEPGHPRERPAAEEPAGREAQRPDEPVEPTRPLTPFEKLKRDNPQLFPENR